MLELTIPSWISLSHLNMIILSLSIFITSKGLIESEPTAGRAGMSWIPEHKKHRKRLENRQYRKKDTIQQYRKDALSHEVGCQQKTVELVYGFTVPDICYVFKSSKALFLHLVNPFLSKACDTSVGQKRKKKHTAETSHNYFSVGPINLIKNMKFKSCCCWSKWNLYLVSCCFSITQDNLIDFKFL